MNTTDNFSHTIPNHSILFSLANLTLTCLFLKISFAIQIISHYQLYFHKIPPLSRWPRRRTLVVLAGLPTVRFDFSVSYAAGLGQKKIPRWFPNEAHDCCCALTCFQNSKMPYCSIRTVILDGYCPPWKIVLCATTVVWLLKPSFVLLFGNTKFFALEVIVTRIRCPFLKQLEIFVVRIVSGTTSPGFKKSAWSNPLRYFADKIPSASLIERPFSSTSVNRTMKSVSGASEAM